MDSVLLKRLPYLAVELWEAHEPPRSGLLGLPHHLPHDLRTGLGPDLLGDSALHHLAGNLLW